MKNVLTRLSVLSMTLIPAAFTFAAEPEHGDAHAGGDHAAEGSVMDFDLFQFFMAIVVFGIAFFILSKTAWPKILGGLEARDEKIKSDLASAETAREQAQTALAEYEKALAEARSEAAAIVEKARSDQQKIAAELKGKKLL